jgi:hypothetical protein
MEIPVPSLENVKVVWDWVIQRLELWFRVLRDPAGVLRGIELSSTNETITAIQFSIFPLLLNTVLMVPPFLMASKKEAEIGIVAFFAISLITNAFAIFIYSFGQRLSAALVAGKGRLNACTISTLYATAYWPLSVIVVYVATNHRNIYDRLNSGVVPSNSEILLVCMDFFILAVVLGYPLFKYAAMTRVVHRVGGFRALFICLMTAAIAFSVINLMTSSTAKTLFGLF